MKICKSCGSEKSLEQFKSEKRNSDGKTGKCLECIAKHKREYRKTHVELVREQDKRRRNLPHVLEYQKNYFESNRNELNKQARHRYEINKEPYLIRSKEQKKRLGKKYHEYLKEYRIKNRKRLNEYVLNKLHTNVNYRLRHKLRGQLRKALKNNVRTNSVLVYLGCTIEFFKEYLESKFYSEMTWDNYGKIWHIDHILPCISFDLSKEENRHKCFHYTNLQPLLAVDNLKKQDRLPNGKLARHENRLIQHRSDPVFDAPTCAQ